MSAAVVRAPAEKPFIGSDQSSRYSMNKQQQNPQSSSHQGSSAPRKVSQMMKRRPTGSHATPSAPLPAYQSDKLPLPQRGPGESQPQMSPTNSDDGIYATSETIGPYASIQDPSVSYSRGPNHAPAPPLGGASDFSDSGNFNNLQRAASLPDFHQNNLTSDSAMDSSHAITDIDDLVRSSSVDNMLTPAPAIPPVVKQALVDELKSKFHANRTRERVEKASEFHKNKPPPKNSMRGRRCYDPAFEEEMKQQMSPLAERNSSQSWREKPPETWNNRNVCDWLNYQGFNTVAPAMKRESLEGRDLRDLTKKDLSRYARDDPLVVEDVYQAIDQLFAQRQPNNTVQQSPSMRKPPRRAPPSFRNKLFPPNGPESDRTDAPRGSFIGNKQPVHRNTKLLKSKIPSFSRPGSGLLRKVSNLSNKPRRSRAQNQPLLLGNKKKLPGDAETEMTHSSSSVAERARMFQNGEIVRKAPSTSVLNSAPPSANHMQTELGRVQSIKHDLEVAERHRKLEHIFERKKKEESFRIQSKQHSNEASRDPEEEVAPILKMRELTVHCEAVSELAGIKDTAGPVKPEYDWISYEVPENSTSRELLSQHLKGVGFGSTEDPFVALETRECIGDKNNQSVFFRRILHSAEKLFATQASWAQRQRHYFEIIRKSHLPEALSCGAALDSCGRCPGLERSLETLYHEANDALDIYAETLVVVQRVKQTSQVAVHSNPHDLEAVLKEQLHHVIGNLEGLKKKRASQVSRTQNKSSGASSSRQLPNQRSKEIERLMDLGPSLCNSTTNTAIKIYELEEKYLVSQIKDLSRKQDPKPNGVVALSELSSSLYASLSVSGYATIVSAELSSSKIQSNPGKGGNYNFKLASLRFGGVVIASQESDSLLQEGDRLIEVNGHVVVMSNTEQVNKLLENSTSVRIVAMRTESRDKVITSTMEAADLREDMRLVVSELQREAAKSKRLTQKKAELLEVIQQLQQDNQHLKQQLQSQQGVNEESSERQTEIQAMLDALTQAHKETCDHLSDVTKEKMELSDLLGEREKEVEKLKEKNKKCNDALDAMETEYEEMLRTKDPKKGGTGGALKEHMDSDTREQLCSVEKQNLVEALRLNIEESTQTRAELDSLKALVEQHAPHVLKMHSLSKPTPQGTHPNPAPSKPTLQDHSWNTQNNPRTNHDSSLPQLGDKNRRRSTGTRSYVGGIASGDPWTNGGTVGGMFDNPDGRTSASWLLNAPSPYRRQQELFSPLDTNKTRRHLDIDDDFGFESESDHAI